MSEINKDWRGFVLINPFLKVQISLSIAPKMFIVVITDKVVIPDSSIDPERKLELDGLLITLGHDKGISWEIPDWEIPTWFLTYVDEPT